MRQIVKTELIYYKTPKDFEYEFNLGGVCQMRLLSQVAETRKEFLIALSKAVSRSKIVLINCEVDDVIVNTLAAATGSEKEILDNATFDIKVSPIKEVIKGSVPLVSSNGTLGGFILERGPQTLIVLTNDKPVRNNIMSNFVNQYFKDVSEFVPDDTAQSVPAETPAAPEPTPEILPAEPLNEENSGFEIEEEIDVQSEETPADPEPIPQEDPEIPEEEPQPAEEINEYESDSTALDDTPEETEKAEETPSVSSNNDDENAPSTVTLNLHQIPSYVMDDSIFDDEENIEVEEVKKSKKKKNKDPMSITSIFFLIIICFLVIFIGYTFVIEPVLNGKSIVENFQYYLSILFGR